MDKESPEIAKLAERIAKDPKSKLFVPLAEEYKKLGEIDMAISVLTEGLENNPSYATARSFLGRLLMEKGDLAGAQRELEEVVKAIPDNLLAQRKLGDVFVLLGRNTDALQRYQAALLLNPGDKELPGLIADLEAGRDVSPRISKPKTPSPAPVKPGPAVVPAVSRPQPPGPPAVGRPASPSSPPSLTAKAAASPPASAAQPRTGAPTTGAAAAPGQLNEPEEVVEEIVELEALEPSGGKQETAGPGKGLAAETLPPLKPRSVDDPAEASFDISEPTYPAGSAPIEGTAAAGDRGPAGGGAAAAADSGEGNEDINTDTLAELYTAQGFFDKAIEIYQRMLTERPDSEPLQRKLAKLHALAASQAQEGMTAGGGAGQAGGEAREYVVPSPIAAERLPAEERPPSFEPTPEELRTGGELARETSEATHRPDPSQASTLRTAVSGPANRRQETIDRLETWLKNVMKEKPQ